MRRKFKRDAVPRVGQAVGIEIPQDWTIQDAWPLLDKIRAEGAVILLKLDGLRERDFYTVVVSDGGLKSDDVLRTDKGSIEEAIAFAIGSYALVGMLIGALGAGVLTDRIGRRRIMLLGITWFSVISFEDSLCRKSNLILLTLA